MYEDPFMFGFLKTAMITRIQNPKFTTILNCSKKDTKSLLWYTKPNIYSCSQRGDLETCNNSHATYGC